MSLSEDADLHLRLAGNHRFERLPEPLGDKRDHSGNRSADYRALYEARGQVLEKSLDRDPFVGNGDVRRFRARQAYGRATSALEAGEANEAIRDGRETLRYERRPRAALVVFVGLLDRASGPFEVGHRLVTAYVNRPGR